MIVSQVMKKMIEYSNGNRHDINHLIKVWTYAKTIGELEGLDENTLFVLEIAAIIHDIACPLCREKYGNTNGKHQEEESEPLVRAFLHDFTLEYEQMERIVFLVCHHHTYSDVSGMDYQILIEADYLVNADESGLSEPNIMNTLEKMFKTESGISILKRLYLL